MPDPIDEEIDQMEKDVEELEEFFKAELVPDLEKEWLQSLPEDLRRMESEEDEEGPEDWENFNPGTESHNANEGDKNDSPEENTDTDLSSDMDNEQIEENSNQEDSIENDEEWDPRDDSEYENTDELDENWDPGADSEYEDKEKENFGAEQRTITIQQEEGREDSSEEIQQGQEKSDSEEKEMDAETFEPTEKWPSEEEMQIEILNEEVEKIFEENQESEQIQETEKDPFEDLDNYIKEAYSNQRDQESEQENKEDEYPAPYTEGFKGNAKKLDYEGSPTPTEQEINEVWEQESYKQLEEGVEELHIDQQMDGLKQELEEVEHNIEQLEEKVDQLKKENEPHTEGFKGNAKKLDYEGTSAPTEEEIEQESLRETAEEISERSQEQKEETVEEAKEILSEGCEEICEQQQERERIEEQEQQQVHEQAQEQKEKPIKANAKKMEVITNKEELEKYDQNESIPILRGNYGQEEKSAQETRTEQDKEKKPEKHNARKMVVITEKEALDHYDHTESIPTLRGDYEEEQKTKQKSKIKDKQEKHNAKRMELYVYEQEVHEAKKEEIEEQVSQDVKKEPETIQDHEKEEKDAKDDEEYEKLKQKYHEETGGRALYGGKETKGFSSWKEEKAKERQEPGKNQENSANQARTHHKNENRWELREPEPNYIVTYDYANQMDLVQEVYEDKWAEWAYQLENWIERRDYAEKMKVNLLQKLYRFQRDLSLYQRRNELVEELRQYYREKHDQESDKEKGLRKQINYLTQELNNRDPIESALFQKFKAIRENFFKFHEKPKNEAILEQILNENKAIIQKFKENLKENLYRYTELSMKEKQKIIQFIQKENLTKEEKEIFKFILSKLPEKEINSFKIKKCSHCHKVLSYSDFYKRSGKRGWGNKSKNYQSICKECSNLTRKLRRYKKKLKLINELFDGKCHQCGLNLESIVLAHFHHPFAEYKTAEWLDVQDKSISDIIKWAKNDKVIPLCNNCHKKEGATLFEKFKDLILMEGLFDKTPEELNDLLIIGEELSSHEKTKIQKWLRKRYIIEKLFEGKCIGCGEVNIFNNFPGLTLHHRDPSIKSVKMEEIFRDNDCETIFEIILKEDAVCLCANCHSIFHSDLHLHLEEVFNNEKKIFKKKYREKYRKLLTNIKNFKFKQIDLKSPLKLEFDLKELWELNLLEAFYFMQENNISKFWTSDFIKSFDYERQYANEIFRKLEKKGFLRKVLERHHIQARYEMTKKGIERVNELIEKHKAVSVQIKERAKLQEQDFANESERTISHNDVNERYPFHIFKIILQNGFNEFTNIQLAERVERQARTINNNLKEILIPKGIVEKVKTPLYIQTFQYNNVFRLTAKGYQLIQKYFKKSPTFEEINKIDFRKIKNDIIRYSIFIFNLIRDKGYNEFIKKEIYELAQTEQKDLGRFTGYLLRTKLIPEGIIKEVKYHQFISTKNPSTKVFSITEKGLNIAKKFMNNV